MGHRGPGADGSELRRAAQRAQRPAGVERRGRHGESAARASSPAACDEDFSREEA